MKVVEEVLKKLEELGIEEVRTMDGKRFVVFDFKHGHYQTDFSEEELEKLVEVLKWTFDGDNWWQERNRRVLKRMRMLRDDVLFEEARAELTVPGLLELAHANNFGRWIRLVFRDIEEVYLRSRMSV